jgi:hypothetical protein
MSFPTNPGNWRNESGFQTIVIQNTEIGTIGSDGSINLKFYPRAIYAEDSEIYDLHLPRIFENTPDEQRLYSNFERPCYVHFSTGLGNTTLPFALITKTRTMIADLFIEQRNSFDSNRAGFYAQSSKSILSLIVSSLVQKVAGINLSRTCEDTLFDEMTAVESRGMLVCLFDEKTGHLIGNAEESVALNSEPDSRVIRSLGCASEMHSEISLEKLESKLPSERAFITKSLQTNSIIARVNLTKQVIELPRIKKYRTRVKFALSQEDHPLLETDEHKFCTGVVSYSKQWLSEALKLVESKERDPFHEVVTNNLWRINGNVWELFVNQEKKLQFFNISVIPKDDDLVNHIFSGDAVIFDPKWAESKWHNDTFQHFPPFKAAEVSLLPRSRILELLRDATIDDLINLIIEFMYDCCIDDIRDEQSRASQMLANLKEDHFISASDSKSIRQLLLEDIPDYYGLPRFEFPQ